jgi:hypothetical protein
MMLLNSFSFFGEFKSWLVFSVGGPTKVLYVKAPISGWELLINAPLSRELCCAHSRVSLNP